MRRLGFLLVLALGYVLGSCSGGGSRAETRTLKAQELVLMCPQGKPAARLYWSQLYGGVLELYGPDGRPKESFGNEKIP